MNLSDAQYAAEVVARRVGLPVNSVLIEANRLVLTPSEIHENDGFSIEVKTSWRTVEVSFLPGKFARPLIARMGAAGPESRIAFSALATAASTLGKLTLRVDGITLDAKDTAPWPPQWQKFELFLKKSGVVFEELDTYQFKQMLGDIVTPIVGMCIALIGIEDVDAGPSAAEGDPFEIKSQRFERKPLNREICLSVRGHRCYCCDMDFGETYGPLANGYIEVHHITPVSELGIGYRINPVTELVPICSNCHSVVHLAKPPISVDDLRTLLGNK